MQSFIAASGLSEYPAARELGRERWLRGAGERFASGLGVPGVQMRATATALPEVDGGWIRISREDGEGASLLAEDLDDEYASLVLGQVDESAAPGVALRQAFRAGGMDAVIQLAGMFCGVLVDRREGRSYHFVSALALRALRWHRRFSSLIVSPMDLGVAAAARLDVDVRMDVAATTVACGWSLGGRSLQAGIEECDSHACLVWQHGEMESRPLRPLLSASRVEGGNPSAVDAQVDRVVDELQAGVARDVEASGAEQVGVSLTAGVDSRAALSLLLSVVEPRRLRAFTAGLPNEMDVRVASALCRRLGIAHESAPREPPDLGRARRALGWVAAVGNGCVGSEVALSLAHAGSSDVPRFGGTGGEVYRGYYYPYLRRPPRATRPEQVADALWRWPFSAARKLPFLDATRPSAIVAQLRRVVGQLAVASDDAHDVADLFYVFERYSRWGSAFPRLKQGRSLGPFANARAIREAFRLPSPIGDARIIARTIQRSGSPALYWLPINERDFVWLEGPGQARYALRETLRGAGKLARVARGKLSSKGPDSSAPHTRLRAFAERMSDELLRPGSLARELFPERALEEALAGRGLLARGNALGILLSMELWRAQMAAARSSGARD